MIYLLAQGLNSKRLPVHFSELKKYWGYHEVYHTIHGYPEDDSDNIFIERVYIDIDPQEGITLEELLEDAIDKLISTGVEEKHIFPYYSGRGLHIVLPNVWGFITIEQMKNTIPTIIPYADTIYNKNRVIRLVNTYNDKTGHIKFPISIHCTNIESDRKDYKVLTDHNIPVVQPYLNPIQPLQEPQFKSHIQHRVVRKYPCIKALIASGPIAGYRHNTILRLASHLRFEDYDEEYTTEWLRWWMHDNPIPDKELKQLVHDVFHANNGEGYHYGCNDWLLKKHCSHTCILYNKTDVKISNPEEYLLQYLSQKPILDLGDILPLKYPYKLYKKDLITVHGKGGVGKTTFMVWLMSQIDKEILWINLEDDAGAILSKYAQAKRGFTRSELVKYISDGNNGIFTGNFNVLQLNKSSRTIEHINMLMMQSEADIVIVDHAGAIEDSSKSNSYVSMKNLSKLLKTSAEESNKLLFVPTHIGRTTNNSNQMMDEVNADGVIEISQLSSSNETIERTMRIHTLYKTRRNIAFDKKFKINVERVKVDFI